jgi:hypothetical protein
VIRGGSFVRRGSRFCWVWVLILLGIAGFMSI